MRPLTLDRETLVHGRTVRHGVVRPWGSELPGARLATIPVAGHRVQLDAGASLTAILRAWLVDRRSHVERDDRDDRSRRVAP